MHKIAAYRMENEFWPTIQSKESSIHVASGCGGEVVWNMEQLEGGMGGVENGIWSV